MHLYRQRASWLDHVRKVKKDVQLAAAALAARDDPPEWINGIQRCGGLCGTVDCAYTVPVLKHDGKWDWVRTRLL